MALSAKAQRALQKVKMGLSILYGADYFTEDEWIKIDGLIHKGKYFFTHGPPSNLLEEQEQLMSFGDEETLQALHKQTSRSQSEVALPEPSPPSSDGGMISQNSETPNDTSNSSSDGDALLDVSSRPMFDFSDTTTTLATIPNEQPKRVLPPGITQEQLDHAKSLATSMTKAGHKKREQYTPIDEYASSNWAETVSEYASPVPTERESRISSWASEVDAAEAAEAAELAQDVTPKKTLPAEGPAKAKARKFNNKYPKKAQSKGPPRPESRASTKTMSTVKPVSKLTPPSGPSAVAHNAAPKLNVKPGTVLIAQQRTAGAQKVHRSVQKEADAIRSHRRQLDNIETSNAAMWDEVDEGLSSGDDHLPAHSKYAAEHVSDTNEWTEVTHQPKSDAPNGSDLLLGDFEDYHATEWDKAAAKSQKAVAPPASRSDPDTSNAVEWNEVPIRKQKKTAVVAPPTKKSEIVTSRFAALEVDTMTEPRTYTMDEIKAFEEVFNTDFNALLKRHGIPPTGPRFPGMPAQMRFNESLSVASPKTQVCWFWFSGKGCRFTEEECKHLHHTVPGVKPNFDLKNGKPNWGALADCEPLPPITLVESTTLTCWYWATLHKCSNSRERCKYLHEHSTAGIAPKPKSWSPGLQRPTPKQWTMDWKRAEGADEQEGKGRVAEFLDVGAGGDETGKFGWGDEKYKAPSIVSLENRVRKESVGW